MTRFKRYVLAALPIMLSIPGTLTAQEIGKASFMANCAVCHGGDGKGGGPIIDFLNAAPSDLTKISERNGGQFPIQRIYAIIADAEQTRGHGTSEMPIWGNRFNAEIIAEEGDYGAGTSGIPTAQSRILELVYFLATIQTPE